MPLAFLTFDFGTSEDAAQQARHRLEGWRQALHLGDRLQFKFERKAAEAQAESAAAPEKKKKAKKKGETDEPAAAVQANDRMRVLVRLEFSDHEKLSYQRWIERIPAEAPFATAEKAMVRRGQDGFEETSSLFDELP